MLILNYQHGNQLNISFHCIPTVMHLASIHSYDDQINAVNLLTHKDEIKLITNSGSTQNCSWIGITDINKTQLSWIDGTISKSLFISGTKFVAENILCDNTKYEWNVIRGNWTINECSNISNMDHNPGSIIWIGDVVYGASTTDIHGNVSYYEWDDIHIDYTFTILNKSTDLYYSNAGIIFHVQQVGYWNDEGAYYVVAVRQRE